VAAVLMISMPTDAQEPYEGYYRDYEWTQNNFGAVLDALFPLGGSRYPVPGISFRQWQEDGRVLETSFQVYHDHKTGQYRLVYRAAGNESVFLQILDARRISPTSSIGDLIAAATIVEWTISGQACPPLLSSVREFSEIQMPIGPLENPMFVLHPVMFEFDIQFQTGSARISIVDPKHPLVLWATETLDEIRQCTKSE